MKVLVWRSVVLAAAMLGGSAWGADIGSVTAGKAIPDSISSWTGLYAGFGLGFRAVSRDVATTSETLAGVPQNLADGRVDSQSFDGAGVRINPYVGYNVQVAPRWVAGLEGDAGFGRQTTTRQSFPFSPGFLLFALPPDSLAVRASWDASLRGRLGFLVTPATLAYATGGIAWQRLEVTSTCISIACGGSQLTPAVVTNATTRTGWTLGGGIETAIDGHWLVRGEYRYADFGDAPFSIERAARPASGRNPIVDQFHVAMQTHTATLGIAYKFGPAIGANPDGEPRTWVAKAAPLRMSWTGAYAGLGVGARAARGDLNVTGEVFGGNSLPIAGRDGQPLDSIGVRIVPYVGANWQFATRWVVGIEADAGIADRTATIAGYPFSPAFGTFHSAADSLAVKTTWDASLRARLGFLVTPATLLYGTGGVAWQHREIVSTCGSAPCQRQYDLGPPVITLATTEAGWTLGGGVETSLGGNWLVRTEYRYADFGRSNDNLARTSSRPINNNVDSFTLATRTHTATLGLAYRFD